MATRRVACVWLPRFSLANARARLTNDGAYSLALYNPDSRSREIVVADPDVLARGVQPGLPLTAAEARCPDVLYRTIDPALDDATFASIADILDTFSPVVEVKGAGIAFLDIDGLELLYGPEDVLAQRLRRAIPEPFGATTRIGIADGRTVAEIASRHGIVPNDPGITIVPAGANARFLAPLPIEALPISFDAAERLRMLGIRAIGDIGARLPRNALVHRLDHLGETIWRLSRGETIDEPLSPRPRPLVTRDEIELEWAEESNDRLIFLLKGLADRLARRLDAHGLAAHRLRVTWRFDTRPALASGIEGATPPDAAIHQRDLFPAEGSASGASIHEILRWHLEGAHLRAPVIGIAIEAMDLAPPRGRQLRLLGGQLGRPASFDRQRNARHAIARLRARWHPDAVRRARAQPSRRPEDAFQWLRPEASDEAFEDVDDVSPGKKPPGRSGPARPRPAKVPRPTPQPSALLGQPPVWIIDPPEPITLRVPGSSKSPIITFRQRQIPLIEWAGPFRVSDLPWRDNRAERDYYQAIDADGRAYWLYHDRIDDRWLCHGIFD